MWACPDCGEEFNKKSGPHIRKHKGKFIPWNKGQTKESNPIIAQYAKTQSKAKMGKPTGRITFSRELLGDRYEEINKDRSEKIGTRLKELWQDSNYQAKILPTLIAQKDNPIRLEKVRIAAPKNLAKWREEKPEEAQIAASSAGKIGGLVLHKETPARIEGWKIAGEKNRKYHGPLASNWQGGKSFEEYGLEWTEEIKEQVRQRDEFTCQDCGIDQKKLYGYHRKLCVHHLDYEKNNHNTENLITLCISCHQKRHRSVPRKN